MKKIENVCVIGAGRMGQEIALNAAVYGHIVTLYSRRKETTEQARAWMKSYLEKSVLKGKMTPQDMEQTMNNCTLTDDLELSVKNADLVIETITENLDAKKELFAKIDNFAPSHAIFVSNSSFLSSSNFASITKRPDKVANLHYFNPAMRMELVEIIRGEHVSDDTVQALKDFAKQINKTAILVEKEIDGFIVNRLLKAILDEAFFLLDNGYASFEDIDLAAEKGLNHPMGPFRLMDFSGLDIVYRNRERVYENTKDEALKPSEELRKRFERGDYGKKTGKGWYEYI